MNRFIRAVRNLDAEAVGELLQKEAKWAQWTDKDGKNALHYLCGLDLSADAGKQEASLRILKLLLASGMDMNAVRNIPGQDGDFPATPLWYAYAKGRNEKLYTYLLAAGADPDHCMYAIAWNDDVRGADLFKRHGAKAVDGALLGAFKWKRFAMVEWFLNNGADINVADPEGDTALHYALQGKYKLDHIRLLLKFGADCDQKNNKGISPRDLAMSGNRTKVLGLFNKT